jgi:class 3 adenylate cyclase
MISKQLNNSLAKRYGNSEQAGMIKRAFDIPHLSEAMQVAIANPFVAECCVVFSDISGFSIRLEGKTANQIKDFLDEYYAEVIPIIYERGGLIDQMFGDGIISVFNQNLSKSAGADVFKAGLATAEKIVRVFAGNASFTTKSALHKGQAVICYIGDNNYRQASLVGAIMTVVHRIEAVAKEESVNMLLTIPEAKQMYESVKAMTGTGKPTWRLNIFKTELKGVGSGPQSILYEKYNR